MAASSGSDRQVRFHDDCDEADLTVTSSVDGVCQICLKQASRYTCPRCNLLYCSTRCYKDERHSDCSESFYKENFMEALGDADVRKEDKDRMLEMLKRFEENNPADTDEDDDSCGDDDLAERLQGVDLDADPEQIWERLTEAERAEFADIIKSDNLNLLVPHWVPWWTNHDRELIKEVEDLQSCDTPPDQLQAVPETIGNIPRLSDILKNREPSPLIINDIINVIYSYTLLMRFYNGEVSDFGVEIAQNLLMVSDALSKNQNYGSLEESIHSAIENITKVMKDASGSRLECLQDTTHILLGRCPSQPLEYVTGALSDCWQIVSVAKKNLNREAESSDKALQKQLFACKKKLEFHLAWSIAFPEVFRVTAVEVQCLYKSMLKDQKLADDAQLMIERKKRAPSGKLVEEVMKDASGSRLECLQDTTHILLGRCPSQPLEYVTGALSDCWQIVSVAKKNLNRESSDKALQKQLFACKKKLEFHLAWSIAFPEVFRVTAVDVQCLYKSMLKDQKLAEDAQLMIEREKRAPSGKLVEEVT